MDLAKWSVVKEIKLINTNFLVLMRYLKMQTI